METSPAPPKKLDYPLPGIYLKSYGYGYGLVLVKYDDDEEELLAIKLTGKIFSYFHNGFALNLWPGSLFVPAGQTTFRITMETKTVEVKNMQAKKYMT